MLLQNPAASQDGPQHIEILLQLDHIAFEVLSVVFLGGTEVVVQASLSLEEVVDDCRNRCPLWRALIPKWQQRFPQLSRRDMTNPWLG